jgi:hypothetical protein
MRARRQAKVGAISFEGLLQGMPGNNATEPGDVGFGAFSAVERFSVMVEFSDPPANVETTTNFSDPLANRRRSVRVAAFLAAVLGLVAPSGSDSFAKASRTTAYSICISHCTAIKGNLDPSRLGCARTCHRAKAQCIADGCFGTERCRFTNIRRDRNALGSCSIASMEGTREQQGDAVHSSIAATLISLLTISTPNGIPANIVVASFN